MKTIEASSHFKIEEMEVDMNHLHLTVTSKPNLSPTQIVRKLKPKSTIAMWKTFPKELKKHFWKEKTFWTDGYFVSSIGEISSDTLKLYIQNQG